MLGLKSPSSDNCAYVPIFRSGSYSEMGPKHYMEDEHIRVDNLREHVDESKGLLSQGAYYGVFDGHGGVDAASFTQKNLLKFILEDSHFPSMVKKAVRSAFQKADYKLADTKSLDRTSGTTALIALIFRTAPLSALLHANHSPSFPKSQPWHSMHQQFHDMRAKERVFSRFWHRVPQWEAIY